jgi:hypothetical protein
MGTGVPHDRETDSEGRIATANSAAVCRAMRRAVPRIRCCSGVVDGACVEARDPIGERAVGGEDYGRCPDTVPSQSFDQASVSGL